MLGAKERMAVAGALVLAAVAANVVIIGVPMSNTSFQPGGLRAPALATVCTDQTTIRGSGASDDPLRAISSPDEITFADQGPFDVASAVCVRNSLSTTAIVDQAIADAISPAAANAFVVGLTKSSVATGTGDLVVQKTGVFTATADEWNNITGSPTLVPGSTYYLSPTAAGTLTTTRPVTSGQYIVPIGQALNRTDLSLNIGQPILVP